MYLCDHPGERISLAPHGHAVAATPPRDSHATRRLSCDHEDGVAVARRRADATAATPAVLGAGRLILDIVVTHTPQSCPTFLALIFFLPPVSHLPSIFKAQICAFKIVFFSVDFVACALARASASLLSRFCRRLFPRFSASVILSVLFLRARRIPALIFWYFLSFRCQCLRETS
jgi:hypothetical protein